MSESLAGPIEILTLWPLSQGEIRNTRERFIDLAQIDGWPELPKLLSLLAARSSALMNIAEVSCAAGIAHTTLKRYLALLQMTYLLRPLPPWSNNPGKRLIKSPKVHLVDTGLAAHLTHRSAASIDRDDAIFGNLLESFVVTELHKQSTWPETRPSLHHFRTAAGREEDVVMEGPGNRIVGVEVKASSSIEAKDFIGLNALREAAGRKFVRGIVLYGGDAIAPFGDKLTAAPISALWAA